MAYNGIAYSSVQSPQHSKLSAINQEIDPSRRSNGHLSLFKMTFSSKGFWHLRGKLNNFVAFSRGHPISYHSTKTCNSEARERVRHLDDCPDVCRYEWFISIQISYLAVIYIAVLLLDIALTIWEFM